MVHGNTNVQWDAAYFVEEKMLICGPNKGKITGNSVTIGDVGNYGTVTATLTSNGVTFTCSSVLSSVISFCNTYG